MTHAMPRRRPYSTPSFAPCSPSTKNSNLSVSHGCWRGGLSRNGASGNPGRFTAVRSPHVARDFEQQAQAIVVRREPEHAERQLADGLDLPQLRERIGAKRGIERIRAEERIVRIERREVGDRLVGGGRDGGRATRSGCEMGSALSPSLSPRSRGPMGDRGNERFVAIRRSRPRHDSSHSLA